MNFAATNTFATFATQFGVPFAKDVHFTGVIVASIVTTFSRAKQCRRVTSVTGLMACK